MELPQAPNPTAPSTDVLIRAVKNAYEAACTAGANSAPEVLAAGTVHLVGERESDARASGVFSVRAPDEGTIETALQQIEERYRSSEVECAFWIPNDREPDPEMITGFLEREFERWSVDLMQLEENADLAAPASTRQHYQVIPARSLRREYRALHAEADFPGNESRKRREARAQFKVDSLDDPRLDVLCLRVEGTVTSCAGVFVHGEIGILIDMFTRPDRRRVGFMHFLLGHLLEHCARSQLQTIIAPVESTNDAGRTLLQAIGMKRAATFPVFVRDHWALQ